MYSETNEQIRVVDGKKINLCEGCRETNCVKYTNYDYCKYMGADEF